MYTLEIFCRPNFSGARHLIIFISPTANPLCFFIPPSANDSIEIKSHSCVTSSIGVAEQFPRIYFFEKFQKMTSFRFL